MKKILSKYLLLTISTLSIPAYCMDYIPLPSYATSTCKSSPAQQNNKQKAITKDEYTAAVKAKIAENKKNHWIILPLLKTVGIACAMTLVTTYMTAGIFIIKSKRSNKIKLLALLPTLYPLSILQLIMHIANKKMPIDYQQLANNKRIFAMHGCLLLPALACYLLHHTITYAGVNTIPQPNEEQQEIATTYSTAQ